MAYIEEDTKMLVKYDKNGDILKRHFAYFNSLGDMFVWDDGATSWSATGASKVYAWELNESLEKGYTLFED